MSDSISEPSHGEMPAPETQAQMQLNSLRSISLPGQHISDEESALATESVWEFLDDLEAAPPLGLVSRNDNALYVYANDPYMTSGVCNNRFDDGSFMKLTIKDWRKGGGRPSDSDIKLQIQLQIKGKDSREYSQLASARYLVGSDGRLRRSDEDDEYRLQVSGAIEKREALEADPTVKEGLGSFVLGQELSNYDDVVAARDAALLAGQEERARSEQEALELERMFSQGSRGQLVGQQEAAQLVEFVDRLQLN